jgi:general secretion pathway protein H
MKNKRGFTLIEVMIVLAIMGAVVAIGMPRLFKTQDNIKAVARNFIVLAKDVRNKARVNNSTYRIVIHIDPKESSYSIERANGSQLIDPALMTTEGRKQAEEDAKEKEDKPPPLFQVDKSILKKPKFLPGTLRFVSLETINMQQPQTEGDAYIYFFPQGFVDASALQISTGSGSNVWTIIFNPLTGQADIIEKAQDLKDVQR